MEQLLPQTAKGHFSKLCSLNVKYAQKWSLLGVGVHTGGWGFVVHTPIEDNIFRTAMLRTAVMSVCLSAVTCFFR